MSKRTPRFELYIEAEIFMTKNEIAKVLREVAKHLSQSSDLNSEIGTCYNRWGDGVGHWDYNGD